VHNADFIAAVASVQIFPSKGRNTAFRSAMASLTRAALPLAQSPHQGRHTARMIGTTTPWATASTTAIAVARR
jgi:hypothetical protein